MITLYTMLRFNRDVEQLFNTSGLISEIKMANVLQMSCNAPEVNPHSEIHAAKTMLRISTEILSNF